MILAAALAGPTWAAPFSVEIGLNFTGSTFHEFDPPPPGAPIPDWFPPDTNGSVGPNHIVELENGRYKVYSKATGAPIYSTTLDHFWGTDAPFSVGTRTGSAFDPRIIYDHDSKRWFACSADFGDANGNNLLLAVSKTSNPLDGWTAFSIDADDTNTHFADFPAMGIDRDGVYLTANQFVLAGKAASFEVAVLSVPKSDLLAVAPSIANIAKHLHEDEHARGFALQPFVDFGPSDGRGGILAIDFDDFTHANRTNVVGAGAGGATLSASSDINIPLHGFPPTADQPGGKANLNTGDDRFGSSVFEQGSIIWAANTIDAGGGRSAIHWYKIDEATNAILQQGTISDPNLSFYFPSIAANAAGMVVIGASGSGAGQFVSSYAFTGQTAAGNTTFSGPMLLKAGVDDYQILDNIGRNRWGDYSATVRDPSNPNCFWTFQEFVSADNIWSTQVTQICFVPEPGSLLFLLTGVAAVRRRRRKLV